MSNAVWVYNTATYNGIDEMSRSILFICALFLFGCASSQQSPEQAAAAAKARKQCKSEASTGSIRRVSRCRSQAELDREQRKAQDAWQNRSVVSGGGGAESQ